MGRNKGKNSGKKNSNKNGNKSEKKKDSPHTTWRKNERAMAPLSFLSFARSTLHVDSLRSRNFNGGCKRSSRPCAPI